MNQSHVYYNHDDISNPQQRQTTSPNPLRNHLIPLHMIKIQLLILTLLRLLLLIRPHPLQSLRIIRIHPPPFILVHLDDAPSTNAAGAFDGVPALAGFRCGGVGCAVCGGLGVVVVMAVVFGEFHGLIAGSGEGEEAHSQE